MLQSVLSVDGSGAAGLAGAIGYLVLQNTTNALSKTYSAAELNDKLKSVQDLVGSVDPTKLADTMTKVSKAAALTPKINMAILGGIIAGVVAGLLYNKFHKIKLPEWLGFFAGKRFVPIITSIVMLLLGLVFGQIWPTIQSGIDAVALWYRKLRFNWCWFIRIIKPFINSNRFTPRNEHILLVRTW